jgi:hypothetical protein
VTVQDIAQRVELRRISLRGMTIDEIDEELGEIEEKLNELTPDEDDNPEDGAQP